MIVKRDEDKLDNRCPFFSMIVPVYNVEKHLEKCVHSLLEQENEKNDLEILLIDDGSTDKSGYLCDQLAGRFPEVKAFHEENGGPSIARNLGIKNATGQYILFVDSDDYIEKDTCKKLKEAIIKYGKVDIICFDGIQHIDEETTFMRRIPVLTERCVENGKIYLLEHYKKRNLNVEVWLYAYRKQFLQEHALFFIEGRFHEDVEFTPRVFLFSGKIVELPDRLYHYMVHENSISTRRNKEKNICDLFITLREQCEIAERQDLELKKWMKNTVLNSYLNMVYFTRMYQPQYRKFLDKRFLLGKAATNWNRFRVMICLINIRLYCWMNDCYKKMKG